MSIGPWYVCGEDLAPGATGPFESILDAARHVEFMEKRGDADLCYHNNVRIVPEHMLEKKYKINLVTPEKDRELGQTPLTNQQRIELRNKFNVRIDQAVLKLQDFLNDELLPAVEELVEAQLGREEEGDDDQEWYGSVSLMNHHIMARCMHAMYAPAPYTR